MAASKGMRVACTRVEDRVLASLGELVGAMANFEPGLDIPKAGVLCAIPALLANRLFEGAERFFGKVSGYYTIFHVPIPERFPLKLSKDSND